MKRLCAVLVSAVVVAIMLFSFYSSADTNTAYYENVDKYVTVDGYVTLIIEGEDSDGNKEYEIYVTYECEGRTYENVHYRTDSRKTKFTNGDKVSLNVIPGTEDGEFFNPSRGGTSLLVGVMVGSAFSSIPLFLLDKKLDSFENTTKRISSVSIFKRVQPGILINASFIMCGVSLFVFDNFFVKYDVPSLAKILPVFAVVSSVYIAYFIKTFSVQNYTWRTERCTGKITKNGSDDAVDYILLFNNVKARVSSAVYNSASENELFHLLINKKQPNKVLELHKSDDVDFVNSFIDDAEFRNVMKKKYKLSFIIGFASSAVIILVFSLFDYFI